MDPEERGGLGWGRREGLPRGMRKLLEEMDIFAMLVVMISWVYTYVRIYQIVSTLNMHSLSYCQ